MGHLSRRKVNFFPRSEEIRYLTEAFVDFYHYIGHFPDYRRWRARSRRKGETAKNYHVDSQGRATAAGPYPGYCEGCPLGNRLGSRHEGARGVTEHMNIGGAPPCKMNSKHISQLYNEPAGVYYEPAPEGRSAPRPDRARPSIYPSSRKILSMNIESAPKT